MKAADVSVENFPDFGEAPGTPMASRKWMLEAWETCDGGEIAGALCSTCRGPNFMDWKKRITRLYLNAEDREIGRAFEGKMKEPTWLAGRVAAKDAVRLLVKNRTGRDIAPTEIVVQNDSHGKPGAGGTWAPALAEPLQLSISHIKDFALAVASAKAGFLGLGVDVCPVRERGKPFIREAFDVTEVALLSRFDEEHRKEWVTRFWCGKEAASKALGRGFMYGPKSLRVMEFDEKNETVTVATAGKLSKAVGSLSLKAFTEYEEGCIFCVSCLEAE
ncbi:4'-phosphopantetheinyl transferase family protein [Thermodesulfobacteriota bacterium]